jgi:uncharacterized membrane protein
MSYFIILLSCILLVCIDFIYLTLIKYAFTKQIQIIQRTKVKVNIYSVILCYIFLVFVINYFILQPKKSIWDAFLLGICIYGIYESTNMALFSRWYLYIAIIDTFWGGILFALTSYIIYTLIDYKLINNKYY